MIVCTPLFIAARLLTAPPPALQAAAAHLQYAPWLVSNLHLSAPLAGARGHTAGLGQHRAGPSSRHGAVPQALPPGLGYVNATHQSLQAVPGATVLTHYWALGAATASQTRQRRRALLQASWTTWARRVVSDELQPCTPTSPASSPASSSGAGATRWPCRRRAPVA